MISVMIVDDIPIFREYLREAIDWKRYGFEICCEAKNGQDALEQATKFEPDIVLSDIMMPFIDGLDLAERLKEVCPNTEVVLITGNSEFEYARKAVKLGVADYIVKPFEKEELIVTLLNLKGNIEKAMEIEIEKEDELSKAREHLFTQMIYSKQELAICDDDFQTLDLNIACDDFYYITVIETEANLKEIEQSEQALNWRSVLGNLYNDYIQIKGQQYFFKDYEGRIVFLNCLKKESFYELAQDELETLIKLIKERMFFNVTIGVGKVYEGIKGIRQSYLESLNALNNRFLDGCNRVIVYENLKSTKGYGFYSAEINETIINHLNQLNMDKTLVSLNSIFYEVDILNYSFEYRKMVNMGLLSLLLSYVVKAGKDINSIFNDNFSPYSIVQNESDAVQRDFILSAYKKVISYLLEHKDTQASIIANKAKEYIDDHYDLEDFSMNILSKELLVNQTYLRKMFKSELGMTISEYLLKVRMDHAKNHILDNYYKLSAVSELVGYKDPGYFSKCFKKYFGVSPSDYSEFQS